jgi:hypothetical protein
MLGCMKSQKLVFRLEVSPIISPTKPCTEKLSREVDKILHTTCEESGDRVAAAYLIDDMMKMGRARYVERACSFWARLGRTSLLTWTNIQPRAIAVWMIVA